MTLYYLYYDEICEKTQQGVATYKNISQKGVIVFTEEQIKLLSYFLSDIKYKQSIRYKLDNILNKIKDKIFFRNFRQKLHEKTKTKDLNKELEAFDVLSNMLVRDESI